MTKLVQNIGLKYMINRVLVSLCLSLFTVGLYAQTPRLVYFTDKQNNPYSLNNPTAFLSQASNSGQSKQPLTTNNASALQEQDSQPKSTGNKGSFKWRANIDRKQLYPQEICDTWIRRAYARDRIMLNVRHIIKRDPVNARVIHSCQMHYRLKPPSSLIQGLSLNDYTRPRTQEETSLYNAMSQACFQRYGLGYGINLGKYGTPEETKVYCAKRTSWVKVYE
jgi:hypothetical protein